MRGTRWQGNDGWAAVVGVIFLAGFFFSLRAACRDVAAGYRFRLENHTAAPVEVYYTSAQPGEGRARFIGDVGPGCVGGWMETPLSAPGELVFAPRNSVQRIGRVELGGDAVRGIGNKDVPLVIRLRQTETTVASPAEITFRPTETSFREAGFGEKPSPRLGWNLPLLYVAAVGWFGTFWCGRLPGGRRNIS